MRWGKSRDGRTYGDFYQRYVRRFAWTPRYAWYEQSWVWLESYIVWEYAWSGGWCDTKGSDRFAMRQVVRDDRYGIADCIEHATAYRDALEIDRLVESL